jgi:hypothetical protein
MSAICDRCSFALLRAPHSSRAGVCPVLLLLLLK